MSLTLNGEQSAQGARLPRAPGTAEGRRDPRFKEQVGITLSSSKCDLISKCEPRPRRSVRSARSPASSSLLQHTHTHTNRIIVTTYIFLDTWRKGYRWLHPPSSRTARGPVGQLFPTFGARSNDSQSWTRQCVLGLS